jgi:hypothetical protein
MSSTPYWSALPEVSIITSGENEAESDCIPIASLRQGPSLPNMHMKMLAINANNSFLS